MTFQRRILSLACLVVLAAPAVAAAQDLHPSRRPSPLGLSRIALGDAYVSIIYGRPYKRGRNNIFGTKESGALVPFGDRWRAGANEATEVTVTKDVSIAGKPLAAGTYSLSATPGPDSWTLHFNSRLGLDGLGTFANDTFTPVDLAPTDVLVVTAKTTQLPEDKEVDQFTIDLERTSSGADMVLRWIRTEVRVPLSRAGK